MLRWVAICLLLACGSGTKSTPDALAIGTACFDSSQCASGYCHFPMTAGLVPPKCGTCTTAGAATGDPCSSTVACAQAATCVGGTCVAEAAMGEACDATSTTAPR